MPYYLLGTYIHCTVCTGVQILGVPSIHLGSILFSSFLLLKRIPNEGKVDTFSFNPSVHTKHHFITGRRLVPFPYDHDDRALWV